MRRLTPRFATTWLAVAALLVTLFPSGAVPNPLPSARTSITVSAAASLKDALQALEPQFEQAQPDAAASFNFGASGALQLQIEQGAPADVFISAAAQQMDALAAKNLLLAGTRFDLLRNELVLIVPRDSKAVGGFSDLTAPSVRVVAIGDPRSVPAGLYAKQVLTALGIYDAVKSKAVLATDVRQILADVETGSADAGLVYATDAAVSRRVRIAAQAPAGTHEPIVYPAAVLAGSAHAAAARAFLDFLKSSAAAAVFSRYGFQPVEN